MEIIKFKGKWMDLETIIMSEVSWTHKDKYCIGKCYLLSFKYMYSIQNIQRG